MSNQRILIAAGGTGGHIYPALAIALALRSLEPKIEIEFVGTAAGLENKIVPGHGYPLHRISIGRLNRNVSVFERLWTLLRLPWAMAQSFMLVLRLRPRFVLGVGGYATGPVVLAAALMRRKTFLWEPNAHPGMANRILAPFVTQSLVVFKEAGEHLGTKRLVQVGMPVRALIEQTGRLHREKNEQLHVLIFGGSQGARAVNNVVSEALIKGDRVFARVKFVHQTGAADFAEIKARYEQAGTAVDVQDYLHDMERRYAWADLVVARSGTGTVSELAACGKAAILVPLPSAADNHQQRNAEVLVRAGAAVMVLQKDFTVERFISMIGEFAAHPEKIDGLARSIRQFHRPNASQEIARHLLEESAP